MINRNFKTKTIHLLVTLKENKLYYIKQVLFFTTVLLFSSCKKEYDSDNYTAFFGGEIINPNNRSVIFYKNNKALDTILLDANNRFFIKFDSLTPGLYSFKHEPEYQYIYFDKNDSLMMRVNSKDFDESLTFCGRGYEKNNFLMEMYLKNEKDSDKMFDVFDDNINKFNAFVENNYKKNKDIYNSRKEEIKWTDGFDIYANAIVDFPYYTKKEIYPIVHKMRTGEDVIEKLPIDYYNFRKTIDFSNESLTEFSPYVMYLNYMLNNLAAINYHNHFSEVDLALKTNINKLKVTDTLIKNEKVKNIVLNSIAFQYLIEDQNMVNNKEFLKVYNQYSTDKSQKNEINKIGKAIQNLNVGKLLPNVILIDTNGKPVSTDDIIKKNTVFFFWTKSANSHMLAAHKKIAEFQKTHPNYDFIAINLNDTEDDWINTISKNNLATFKEYRSANFSDLKNKWAITKVHRTIVVNSDKTIKNAFTNIFDVHFEENLK